MSRKLIIISTLLILSFLFVACSAQPEPTQETNEQVVAIVNGKEIKSDPQIEQHVLDNLIRMEVFRQEAEFKGYIVTEEEVNARIDRMANEFGSQRDLESALEANDMTMEMLRDSIADEMLINKYISQELPQPTVAEEEVRTLYEQYRAMQIIDQPFEDIRERLENEIRQQMLEQEIGVIIERLMDESSIEILI
ncbi:SurA N-terminal domain-containing protein [Desulfuribacillus alkaliarsenatis]|uniref:peptidylprolyl isomerase n=1 Tax=Desulfuribacillus alkaliarsenatis TaxID=766136 RepID=A0A1E5G1Z4_9FIRM|nr:SurA N-terminal domain-containing protein [Desulfuribacillus alkaliarsenatis]OEF96846.1 hypothetical protein BHF68_07240 [Desulfuribacillus alkaliarsenatis]